MIFFLRLPPEGDGFFPLNYAARRVPVGNWFAVSPMTHHLVVIKKPYLDRILLGIKTAECRLSQRRRPPFGVVRIGDLLWLKQSGGHVRGTATVRRVEFVHPLGEAGIARLQRRYGESLKAAHDFFDDHKEAKYATIIKLGRVRQIKPFRVGKTDRRAWVVLATPPATHL